MMRVEMIRGGNLDQLVPARELLWQRMKQIKSADYKSGYQRQDRCAQEKKQEPEQVSGFGSLGEKIIAQSDEGDGNGDQCNKPDEPVKHDG